MERINTSLKLYFLLGVMSVVIFIAGTYGIKRLETLNQITGSMYTDRLVPIRQLSSVYFFYGSDLYSILSKVKKQELTYKEAEVQLEESEQEAKDNWKAYQFTFLTSKEVLLTKELNKEARRAEPVLEKLKSILKSEDSVALDNFVLKELNQAVEPIGAKINELIELQVKVSEEKFIMSGEIYDKIKRNAYLFLFLSLSFCLFMGCYIIKNVRLLIKNLELSNGKIVHSENKFRKFIKNAGDAIFIIDRTFQITEVNNSACKLLNYSSGELQSMKMYDLMTERDQKSFQAKARIIDIEGASLHERIFVRKDGSFVETEVNVNHVGRAGYIAVIRDITEHKKAEIKIKETEERYKAIISVSNTGAWEYLSETVVWCSPEYFLMLGRKQSDYDMSGADNINEVWLDLLHPEDRKRSIEHYAEYLKKGSIGMYENYFRMLHTNGSWVWIWSRGQTQRDAKGKTTMIGTHIDITEVKKAEIKIRESEERYKSIISVSNTGGWEYHINTKFLWCSFEYFLMLGRKQSDYDMSGAENLKETWIDLLHPEDRERAVNHFAEYLKNGSIGMYESYFRMLHANGSWVWIWSRGQTIRDAHGKLNLTVGTHIDITEHKKAEIKISESEEKFRLAFMTSTDAFFIGNLDDGRIIDVNDVFYDIFGYSRDEVVGKTITELNLFAERSKRELFFSEINKKISVKDFELKCKKKNGEIITVSTSSSIWEMNGHKFILGVIKDITERKRIDRELITSKEQLRLLIEYSPASLAMFDTEMRYIATSRRWMNDYNLGNKNIIGKSHYEIFPEINQEWKDIHQRCLKGAIERNEEDFFVRADGSKNWIRWEIRPWNKSDGKIGGIIMLTEVITELKESELLFKNLVEKTLVGVYIIQRGKFVYANPKFIDYLGYTQEEMLNINDFREIVDENYIPPALEEWRKKVESGIIEDFHIELKYKRKDGKIIWAEVFCGETIYNGAKAILGSFQDITERKLMEVERQKMLDEMLQRNRDLEQFAYIVSHNLRAPVANIIGISDYMLNPEMEADEKEEMNSGLRESVSRLDGVIKDLNDILQMKREISEKKEIVRFSEIMENIKMSIVNLIEKEEVVFISDFTAVDEMVTIKSYLYSIFYNLISNSIKYRRPEVVPVIQIKSAIDESKIEITYKDNGLGIDLEKKGEQVFGLYKRFHTHAEGKGMGLFMVKTQVETLGGTISIKSKINEGTEFIIEFEIEKNNH